jgi:hypothetical protein
LISHGLREPLGQFAVPRVSLFFFDGHPLEQFIQVQRLTALDQLTLRVQFAVHRNSLHHRRAGDLEHRVAGPFNDSLEWYTDILLALQVQADRLRVPVRGMIFRRKFKDLWENHIQKYFSQWPFMQDWYNTQHKEITLPNGSVIAFRDAEHECDIDDFLGVEYMDNFIDEATQLTEKSLQKFEGSNRWTGIPDDACKILHTMNPGGPGHAYMRRVYIKKEYHEKERPQDFAFVPVRAWDNVEWARAALAEASLSDKNYYSWADTDRFRFFVEKTQYGRKLNALPASLRIGWLLGDWDQFAGQYYDIFDIDRHVAPCEVFDYWIPRWLGIDWGRTHNAVCLWNAQVDRVTKTYREMAMAGRSPKALAQEIVDRTPEDERKRVDAIYLSHDVCGAHLAGHDCVANGRGIPTERHARTHTSRQGRCWRRDASL